MIKILADNIDELYIIQNWIECGRMNCPSLAETYPDANVKVNFNINTNRPHTYITDQYSQIAAIRYTDTNEAPIVVKPYKDLGAFIDENNNLVLPPPKPTEDTTNDPRTV